MAKWLLHHLSGRAGLCDGVDSKQSRVGVWQTEGCGLKRQVVTLGTKKTKNFLTHFWLLTSKGSAVALATPWHNLLVTLEPRFTRGPDPRILCNTLKALASALPATAPSLAINAWTRSSLVFTRNSPTWKHTQRAKRYHVNNTALHQHVGFAVGQTFYPHGTQPCPRALHYRFGRQRAPRQPASGESA